MEEVEEEENMEMRIKEMEEVEINNKVEVLKTKKSVLSSIDH